MEDEKAFGLNLALYQGANIGDYINFLVQFRSSLNSLKPTEVIAHEPIYTVPLVEQTKSWPPRHSFVRDFCILRTCGCVQRLLGTEGQQRKESVYPNPVDCDGHIQIVQFSVQGLDRA
ncbi:hypothetical protein TNCV_63201 [Trichonephila clavipes]|nr:hypothetical protein TNCV_63201 [Trichonephila clavipes]